MDNTGYCKQCESLADENAALRAELEQAKAEIAVEAEARETLEKWYTSARDDAKAELALHRAALKVLAYEHPCRNCTKACPVYAVNDWDSCTQQRSSNALTEAKKQMERNSNATPETK